MAEIKEIDSEKLKVNRLDNPTMWQGYVFGVPGYLSTHFDDFFTWKATDYTVTEVGTNTQTIADEVNGVLLLTNAAADNDATTLQIGGTSDSATTGESVLPAAGRTIWLETKLKISDATQSDFLFGLVTVDTTPLANANGIYFRKDDGDTNLDCECNSSSVASTESAVATVSTSYMKLGIKVINTEKVEFWLNDVKKTEISTQIPATEMKLTIHMQNGEAVAKTMSVDYVFLAQTR